MPPAMFDFALLAGLIGVVLLFFFATTDKRRGE
jgi:hypothetical protein